MNEYRRPGQLIDVLLKERTWSQATLAAILGIDSTILSRTISGKLRLSAELAVALFEVFDVPAERFLEIQQRYDLEQARLTLRREDDGRTTRVALLGRFPVSEMSQRGWIDVESIRDVSKVQEELFKFFDVGSMQEIDHLAFAAKRTDALGAVTLIQLAWIQRVRQVANYLVVPKYSRAAAQKAVDQLKQLRSSLEEARTVPRILADAGIRFVLVESLKGSKIDGVCFWLDDNSPVIGMSLRLDRIDNFWFVLRHELEHVLSGHGKTAVMLDTEMELDPNTTSIPEEERVANDVAASFCVPGDALQQFILRKSPIFSERDLIGFARTQNVHPGLVAGQLQRKTERYDLFRNHLKKIRSIISASAAVDGWGDVAPVGI